MIATLAVFTTSSSVVADEKVIKWKLAMKIGEKLYQQEQSDAQDNDSNSSKEDLNEDVVDADYEEVKDDKEASN